MITRNKGFLAEWIFWQDATLHCLLLLFSCVLELKSILCKYFVPVIIIILNTVVNVSGVLNNVYVWTLLSLVDRICCHLKLFFTIVTKNFGGFLVLREDGLTIQLWIEHLAAPLMAPYWPDSTYAKHSIYVIFKFRCFCQKVSEQIITFPVACLLLLNYLRWCRWMLLLDRRILDSNKDMASKHLALYNIRPRRVLLHNKSKRGIQFPDGGHTWPLHNQKQPNLSPGDETCQCQDQHIRKDCQGSVNQFQQQLMKMQMK